MLTAGANPSYVASQLGHEDVEMVFRTYGKFIRDDYRKPKPEFRIVKEKMIGAISVRFDGHHRTPKGKEKPPHTRLSSVWRCLEWWAGVYRIIAPKPHGITIS